MKITTITKVDLKKLMKKKGIKSLYKLSELSGVDYAYLNKAQNGKVKLSGKAWEKVKKFL